MEFPADLMVLVQKHIQVCNCTRCDHCHLWLLEPNEPRRCRIYFPRWGVSIPVRAILTGRAHVTVLCRNPKCVRRSHLGGGVPYKLPGNLSEPTAYRNVALDTKLAEVLEGLRDGL